MTKPDSLPPAYDACVSVVPQKPYTRPLRRVALSQFYRQGKGDVEKTGDPPKPHRWQMAGQGPWALKGRPAALMQSVAKSRPKAVTYCPVTAHL